MPGTVSDVSATLVLTTTRVPVWAAKIRCWSAADSRAYSGSTSRPSTEPDSWSRSASHASRISRSPEQKTSTSPSPSVSSSVTASTTACGSSRSSPGSASSPAVRPVPDVDRVRAAGHLDHRGAAEVVGEALRVDGRARDDQVQVRSLRQQAVQVAEQHVDVERPLVGLVDDDRVVAPEHRVALDLREQDPVGHHLEQGLRPGGVGEPDGEADVLAERRPDLLGDALGDRARGDPAGLRVADQPGAPTAGLQGELGQLGRLARAGGAGDDDDLVVADQPDELLAAAGDRQLVGVAQRRQGLVGGGETLGLAPRLLLGLLGAGATAAATPGGRTPAVLPGLARGGAVRPAGASGTAVRAATGPPPAASPAPSRGRSRLGGRCGVRSHVAPERRRRPPSGACRDSARSSRAQPDVGRPAAPRTPAGTGGRATVRTWQRGPHRRTPASTVPPRRPGPSC